MPVEVNTTQTHEGQLLEYFMYVGTHTDNVTKLSAVVQPSDFYDCFYADIYQTMLNMVGRGDEHWSNYLLLAEELASNPIVRTRVYTRTDAVTRMQALAFDRPELYSLAEAHRVAIIIRDTAARRRLHWIMEQAMHATSHSDFLNAMDELSTQSRGLSRSGAGPVSTVWDGIEEWKTECAANAAGASITTGWPTIDRAFGPLRQGEVVLMAARAGVGKTNAITSIGNHNAARGQNVLYCTMEMSTSEMAERVVAQATKIQPQDMRLHHEKLDVNAAREHLPYLDHIRIYDEPLSVNQLSYVVKQCQADGFTPNLIIVDYIGLFQWEGNKGAMQYERASEIARALKTQAKRLGVALIACSQLNREAGDGTEEPFMHMLRDSGAIEEAADRIMMMWKRGKNVALKVAKNRHGEEGDSIILRYTNGMVMEEISPSTAYAS